MVLSLEMDMEQGLGFRTPHNCREGPFGSWSLVTSPHCVIFVPKDYIMKEFYVNAVKQCTMK